MTKRQRKENIKWLVLVGIVGLAAAGVGYSLRPMPKTAEAPKPTFALDSRLEALADEAGLNKAWLVEAHASVTSNPAICGVGLGCYATNGNGAYIWITEGALGRPGAAGTLAHEYLSYVREFKMSAVERQQGDMLMRQFYTNNRVLLDNRLRNEPSAATKDSDVYLDNIHSTVCTEVSDAYMGPVLTAYCNKWVKTAALPDDLK